MNHKIVSFYHKNLNTEIVELQKKVFNKLNIDLIQYEFVGTHGVAIKDYLDNNEWDVITLFDVDCIPLNKGVILRALEVVNDNTIYGNAQISNSFPYAAPSFLTFTKKMYDESPHKYFENKMYPDENGSYVEADCAEVFVKENLRVGKKQILSYPKSVLKKQWGYDGNSEYPKFEYGNGTLFDNDTFHCFQIRFPESQSIFINFVNKFLNEED
jgi:hypothetical protein